MPTSIINITNIPAEVTNTVLRVAELPYKSCGMQGHYSVNPVKECPYFYPCRGGCRRRQGLGSTPHGLFEACYGFFQKYGGSLKRIAHCITEGGCIEVK